MNYASMCILRIIDSYYYNQQIVGHKYLIFQMMKFQSNDFYLRKKFNAVGLSRAKTVLLEQVFKFGNSNKVNS